MGCSRELTGRLVERALQAELTEHLGYELHQEPPGGVGNTRNGSTPKTLQTEQGRVEIKTPRDRKGDVRASARQEGPAALQGLRRQDPRPVLPRAVDAGYRGGTWTTSTGSTSAAT